jgi:hypothetical protein
VLYGTAEAVPFVQGFSTCRVGRRGSFSLADLNQAFVG